MCQSDLLPIVLASYNDFFLADFVTLLAYDLDAGLSRLTSGGVIPPLTLLVVFVTHLARLAFYRMSCMFVAHQTLV